jgi:microcystin degradation protein MlrC
MPICWQSTMSEPAAGLYRALERLEAGPGISGMSFCMGFPAADFAECAGTIWAYGEDAASADAAADQLYRAVLAAEPAFDGRLYEPDAAVTEAQRLARSASKPIVIADAQDNPGAGGDSDTTGLLRALIAAKATDAAIGLIVDPESAARAHAAGEGSTVRLGLGGKSGVPGDAPLEAEFLVERLSDGRFLAKGPYYNGFRMALGASACLRIGGIRIVLTSDKAQMADLEMFRFVGIEPTAQNILVVKSATHFRADFTPVAAAILVAAAPGSMKIDPSLLPWKHLDANIRVRPGGPAFRDLARRAASTGA